jgi:hypothetical protein
VFTASCPPRELVGLEDRLKTRFESGLVVGLSATPGDEQVPPDLAPLATAPAAEIDAWFVNREKVPWSWPYLQDVLVQETE